MQLARRTQADDEPLVRTLRLTSTHMKIVENSLPFFENLPKRERIAAIAGMTMIAGFFLAYGSYLVLGHSLLRIAYSSTSLLNRSYELSRYFDAADSLSTRLLFRPLLFSALMGVATVVWAFRNTSLFDDIVAFWRSNRGAPRTAMVVLCSIFLIGHFADRARGSFPFIRWGMYAEKYEAKEIKTFDLYGINPQGKRIHINIGRTIPSIQRGAPRRFSETAEPVANGTASAAEISVLDDTASSIATLYSEIHHVALDFAAVIEETIYRDGPGAYRRSSQLVRTISLRHGDDIARSPKEED